MRAANVSVKGYNTQNGRIPEFSPGTQPFSRVDSKSSVLSLLAADTEFGGEGEIALVVLFGEVLQQAFAAVDHGHEAEAGAVVLLVRTHVVGEFGDLGAEHGNLDLGGSDIALVAGVFLHDRGFSFFFH